MFTIFTKLADFIVFNILNLPANSHFAHSLHFFIEDITKIFFLLLVMIYSISFLRASLNVEAIRDYLKGKKRISGYLIGSSFGAITPFCSCSSIPLFLGFTTARIPVGITMAFLITSPMINEVAIILLGSIIGWKFTLVYVATGITAGITGGFIIDKLKAERYLQPFLQGAKFDDNGDETGELKLEKLNFKQRREFAGKETKEIVSRIWKWIIIGVGAGAFLHGFVPDSWISENFGSGQWWTVPSAVGLGIPLYSNASGMVPVAESLLLKGLPVGTTLALMMSTVAASFPEFVMLKQVMQWKLLAIFFAILVSFFTVSGWLFNIIWPGSLIL
jgi:uncharacterized membrane protein YraQ (UPF0718 family)